MPGNTIIDSLCRLPNRTLPATRSPICFWRRFAGRKLIKLGVAAFDGGVVHALNVPRRIGV